MARKKSKANYFTSETEEYIVRYNTSTDSDYRAKIFTDHIYLPFYKLAENIIHTFKFYYTDVDRIEDLKHEIISVLLEEKIMKFDATNGAKAYSYFGTIVKRWLINYNNKNYKKLKQIGSFNDVEDSYYPDSDITFKGSITLSTFLDSWVNKVDENLSSLFTKENELQVADAVLTLFRSRNDLDIFKKKALYIYIREMTDSDTPNVTKVINVLKVDFKKNYQKAYDLGLINTKKL
tara:strand:- start:4229 stop:4933 length:705 start_codon:yes stop_codon:yes gene_type:complete